MYCQREARPFPLKDNLIIEHVTGLAGFLATEVSARRARSLPLTSKDYASRKFNVARQHNRISSPYFNIYKFNVSLVIGSFKGILPPQKM